MTKKLEYQLWVDLADRQRIEMKVGNSSSVISNAWKGGDAAHTGTTSELLNITNFTLYYTRMKGRTSSMLLILTNLILEASIVTNLTLVLLAQKNLSSDLATDL